MVNTFLDPLQTAYQDHIGVDDAVIYLLDRVYSHLDMAGSAVRIMFFDFLISAFNTILPALIREKRIHFVSCIWTYPLSPGLWITRREDHSF